MSFNFKAAITICSDFGAQKNKVSHCFHRFPIYLLQLCPLFVTLWTVAHQAPLSMRFSRYTGVDCSALLQGISPTQGEPASLKSPPLSGIKSLFSQGYGFSCSHAWMWELDCEEGWVPKNWCFWTVVGEDSWESLALPRRSNQSIPKEISPGISLEGMMLKLKLQYFGHLMRRVDSLEKTVMLGGIGGRRRRGGQRMRWLDGINRLNGCESEWTPGVGDGQGGLACCDSWGRKDTTEQLNWTELNFSKQ